MGGCGSTRWEMTVTRRSTEGFLRLDVRHLARNGCLRPGTSAAITWGPATSITAEVGRERPDAVTLRYVVHRGNTPCLSMNETVSLTKTPCTFGGSRIWFCCPGCGGRCAVLYAVAGYFRCRTCHQLAYWSTRSAVNYEKTTA